MASESRVRVVFDLFDRHREAVVRFARRSVDDATAEDIAQEVFARLMRLPDLENREIRSAYLIKIAENLIRRRHERECRFKDAACRLADGRIPGRVAGGPAERGRSDTGDDRRRAREAVSLLSDREHQAVDLVVGRGLSYREAAASMGVKVSDVNNWRHRGVEKMRREADGPRADGMRVEGMRMEGGAG